MKKHVWMAGVVAGACLLAGCSSTTTKTTEKATEAKAQTEAAAAEDATEADEAGDETAEAVTEAAEAEEVQEDVTEAAESAQESVAEESLLENETDADIEDMSEEAELSVEDQLGDRPEYTALDYVTLGEYTGLAVEVDPIVVTEEEIDAAVNSAIQLADKYDVLTEGTVETGDIANIDYEGKLDGVAFDGGTAQGYDLTIGSGTFIDGFEDGLIGVAIGDTVDLTLTFPEAYGNSDLAGQETVFTVTVNSVKRMPEVTDDLVSELSDGEYTTVDAYRAYQEEQLTAQAEQTRKSAINNELMTQLYNTCGVNDYPQNLVDYSVKEMNLYYTTYATMYGMSLEDFVTTYFGMDMETYNAQAEEAVKESIQQELILTAIAENEGFAEITDEIYDEKCAEYAEQLGYEDVEEFKANYDDNRVRASIRMDKALEFVSDNAVITEIVETEAEESVTEAAEESVAEAAETEAVTE